MEREMDRGLLKMTPGFVIVVDDIGDSKKRDAVEFRWAHNL